MKTKIMGILNVTPDSFSDGGDYYNNPGKAVIRAKQMIDEGADYIDIGGESTRPESENVSEEEELRRVLPIITAIRKQLGTTVRLSIDTWKAKVADEALTAGANAVNSLGGFLFDEQLAEIVAKNHCMVIIYHIKGQPKTMQQGKIMYDNVCREIGDFFESQILFGEKYGIKHDQFILDPGIGFGKTAKQNIEILKNLQEFKKCNLPIMIGVSRKSHIGNILQDELAIETPPTERLEGSLAETAIAIQNGASIIRTHDVKETKKFLAVLEKLIQ
jgi:dihydropteroate synthase